MDATQTRRQVELRSASISLGGDGIARYVARSGAEVVLADAKECHTAITELYAGEAYPLLVDIREVKSASREARRFFAGPKTRTTTRAVALLVSSPISQLIGAFFSRIQKPRFPVRLFTSESDALDWLKGFR